MKKLKKVLALGMAGAMALSMAACGGTGTSGSTATGDTASGSAAASGDIPTIKWVMVGNGMPSNYDAWLAQVNPYLEEKIGVHVDVEVVGWGDWDTRRNVLVNTAGDYDILFTNLNTYTNDVATGAFLDITDLLKSTPDLKASVPDDYWDAMRVNGQIYGVPAMKDSSITQYLVMADDAFEQYAPDYDPTTFTDLTDPELTEALQAITDGSGTAAFPLSSSAATYLTYQYDTLGAGIIGMGVKYNDTTGTVVSIFEQPEITEYLELLRSWYNSGIINSDAATAAEDQSYKAASIAQGWSGAAETTWGPNMGTTVSVAQWGPTIISNDSVRGSISCISNNCQYPEKALQLLEIVNTDTYVRDLFYYGVQGENWDYTDDTKQWVHKNNSDWSMAGYTQGSFFTVTPDDTYDFNQYDEVEQLNAAAEPSVLLGFSMDIEPVRDQVQNCITICEKYKSELLTGTREPSELVPQMLSELEGAGFADVMAEAQSQVDAFLAGNPPAAASAETAAE